MKLCDKDCIPCCDFCLFAIHECWLDEKTRQTIIGGPIGCNLHNDEWHQELVESCSYCKDFYCFNVKEELKNASLG